MAEGVGATFFEELAYGEGRQPWATTLRDFRLPLVTDLPPRGGLHVDTPSAVPGGRKGMSESAMVAVLPP